MIFRHAILTSLPLPADAPISHTKAAEIFTGHSQYGVRVMQVWLAAACPKTLIATLGDVLESGNAKNRVNLARFLDAR